MTGERLDGDWQLWLCADCNPEYAAADDDPAQKYDQPYVLLLPAGVPAPDHCPRCASYLPFCEGSGELRITNTPAERWAARRAADAAAVADPRPRGETP
jgi:hypothetical protein